MAYLIAETSFDPAAVSDLYSTKIIEEILEAPLTYDMLARPYKLTVQTAEAMPEITEGGRLYTIRLKKGTGNGVQGGDTGTAGACWLFEPEDPALQRPDRLLRRGGSVEPAGRGF
mgnify:CR=1 FL=1